MAARVISTRREDTPSGLRVEARTWAHDDLSFSGHVVVTGPAPHPGAAAGDVGVDPLGRDDGGPHAHAAPAIAESACGHVAARGEPERDVAVQRPGQAPLLRRERRPVHLQRLTVGDGTGLLAVAVLHLRAQRQVAHAGEHVAPVAGRVLAGPLGLGPGTQREVAGGLGSPAVVLDGVVRVRRQVAVVGGAGVPGTPGLLASIRAAVLLQDLGDGADGVAALAFLHLIQRQGQRWVGGVAVGDAQLPHVLVQRFDLGLLVRGAVVEEDPDGAVRAGVPQEGSGCAVLAVVAVTAVVGLAVGAVDPPVATCPVERGGVVRDEEGLFGDGEAAYVADHLGFAADRRGILVERPVTLHCDYRGEPAQMMEEAIAEAIADAEQRAARVAP